MISFSVLNYFLVIHIRTALRAGCGLPRNQTVQIINTKYMLADVLVNHRFTSKSFSWLIVRFLLLFLVSCIAPWSVEPTYELFATWSTKGQRTYHWMLFVSECIFQTHIFPRGLVKELPQIMSFPKS